MNKKLLTWLIAGGIFILTAAFAIFCGYNVSRFSQQDQEIEPSTEEAETEEETTPPAETRTEAPETEASTEPSSSEEVSNLFTDGVIHELSEARLAEISASYSGEPTNYPLDSNRDMNNRPELNAQLQQEFNERFGDGKVKIFGNTEVPAAYLTFVLTTEVDMNTSLVLDTLKEKDVKALFYVSASYVEANPDVVKRIVNEGHELGSIGSQQETPLPALPIDQQSQDVILLQQAVTDLTGERMTKFYFSYNSYSDASIAMLTEMGYTVCFYSANYADIDSNAMINSDEFLAAMKECLHQGIVYSLHTTNTATLVMLPQLIDYLKENSFTLELL